MLPLLRVALATSISMCLFFVGHDALACGGFFCSQQPVLQTGEKIVFAVDEQNHTVDVIIEIRYAGTAEQFAWVLPLASAPLEMGVGTSRLFQRIDQQTAPRFSVRTSFDANCFFPPSSGGAQDASFSRDAGSSGPAVVVLAEEQVGPYDSVVVQSEDPQAIRMWLTDNGYNVTDEMMNSVRPYVIGGNALLALKLAKNENVGALQPFAVRLSSDEPCIPLKLTSIAAMENMEVTALVLSNQGRAIPTNYLHLQPNFARLNWQNPYGSYRELIIDAADEAGGNAFTTEYAGSSSVMEYQIFSELEYHLANVRAATNLGAFVDALLYQQFNTRSETVGVMRKYILDSLFDGTGVIPADFWSCPNCYSQQLSAVAFDANPAADDLKARILDPDRDAQGLFDHFSYLTRLYTVISPAEMNIDPIFAMRSDLPDVSVTHSADLLYQCDDDHVVRRVRVTLEDGTVLYTQLNGDPTVGPMPAAGKIEDLDKGTVIVDNTPKIRDMANASHPGSTDCTCDTAGSRSTLAGLGLAVVVVALLRRRPR